MSIIENDYEKLKKHVTPGLKIMKNGVTILAITFFTFLFLFIAFVAFVMVKGA